MSKFFVVSDLHINHQASLKFEGRERFSSVEEMNQTIVNNWNKTVSPEDTVYNLGDCFLGESIESQQILKSLGGHKILIRGNHDKKSDSWYHDAGFEEVHNGLYLPSPRQPGGLLHILTHMPLPYREIEALELSIGLIIHNWHGHVHACEDRTFTGNDIWEHPEHYTNVCVELTNYTPIDFPL